MPPLPIPDRVYPHVCAIDPADLRRQGITLLLADLDNTLAKYGQQDPDPAVLAWKNQLQAAGITLFLLSNSRKPVRVAHYAAALDIPFLGHAGKPRSKGFLAAMAEMKVGPRQTAMVGDQIFTDMLGAKCAGVKALLVEPIALSGNPGRYLRYAVETPFRAAGNYKTRQALAKGRVK
ncbi:MAG: YqeG family HAD IIIA-type phosphatase [Pseudoflavonifractor sp.]